MTRSPVVLLAAILSVASVEASARCLYNGNNYTAGMTACVNGERWICLQTGRWETTRERCLRDDEPPQPMAARDLLDRFPMLRQSRRDQSGSPG